MELKIRKVVCDECGRSRVKTPETPLRWLRIQNFKLLYRAKMKPTEIADNYIVNIANGKKVPDPHFCCEACAVKWFKKQLKLVKKGKA